MEGPQHVLWKMCPLLLSSAAKRYLITYKTSWFSWLCLHVLFFFLYKYADSNIFTIKCDPTLNRSVLHHKVVVTHKDYEQ